MALLPREARDGVMRVWLEILRERHPDVIWVPADREGEAVAEGRLEARERSEQALAEAA